MAFSTRHTATTISKMVRGFASAPKASSVQPPIVLHGIDGRYASALYSAAAKKSSLEAVESELKQIHSVIEKDPKVKSFLEDPSQNREHKRASVNALLGKGKYSEITRNLFDLLAENGRLGETPKIINAYQSLMMAHRRELPVTITSAKELDNKTLDQLKNSLSKSSIIEAGQKLIISNKVNPSIVGGLVIEFGDKTIDLSVSSRIAKLNKLLTDSL
ncbi:uncharacterized protein VTP21DRAFT_3484 [Calcarisporiella thermophila]|uniref:uncharacterized protein n=1 Tax=Calcarisporiella thermophila TaxID=911321 RepID=UPI003742509A